MLRLLPLLLLLGACSFSMQLPEDFLQVGGSRHMLRATTPDGTQLLVREFDDPDEGTLAFWTKALRHDLTEGRGYRFVAERPLRDAAGREGHAMQFTTVHEGQVAGYVVALFLVPGWFDVDIRVVELTGAKESFDRQLEPILAAIATLKP